MALTGAHIEAMLRAAGASTSGLIMTPAKIATTFNAAMINYGDGKFNTVDRVAALVSECMVESAYFKTSTEYRPAGGGYFSWQKRYAPYIGRSGIQITWRDNYAKFGAWCKAKKLIDSSDYFVKNLTKLSDHQWFALGAVWYFTHVSFSGKALIEFASNIDQVGKAVNLGNPYSTASPNGASQRRAAFRVVRALGKTIIPAPPTTDSGKPASSASDQAGTTTITVPVQPTIGAIHTTFGQWGPYWSWNKRSDGQGQHGGDDWHNNGGMKDIGNPILAVANGTVIFADDATHTGAGWGAAFGKHVLIEWASGGRTSIDAHMSKIVVKRGQKVKVGDKIGEVGMTGNITGPHDHHEQHMGTRWTDKRVKPIYPGTKITQKIEQEHLDMATQQPIMNRALDQSLAPTKNKKYQVLRLDDKGNVSFGFGQGRYELDLRVAFSGASANDELMVRVIQIDTDKTGKQVGKIVAFPVIGLPGGSGTSWRQFTWRRHIAKPAAGRTRRLRVEVANFSKKKYKIAAVTAAVWKAPL